MRKKVLVWGRKAGIALLPWRVKKCFQTKGGGAMGAKGKYQRATDAVGSRLWQEIGGNH